MRDRTIYLIAAVMTLACLLYSSASEGQEYEFVFSRPEKVLVLGLQYPNGIAVDTSGNIYVIDSRDHCIQKLDPEGNPLTKWGTRGSEAGQFHRPSGLAVDVSGNVYVADADNHRIQKFDSVGNFLMKWGTRGEGDGQFELPIGVGVDGSGNVYVADHFNYRVQKFDSEGNFLTKLGNSDDWSEPSVIAVDASGNVYVVDEGGERIQKFDSEGNFLKKWGAKGFDNGEFGGIIGIAVDKFGNVYVADGENERIQKFDSEGNFLMKWGTYGFDNGQFRGPSGVAVDGSGDVYVADTRNNRIQKFDSAGNFLTKWGTEGSGDGQFRKPHFLAVDVSGNVYVSNSGRIQKFRPVNEMFYYAMKLQIYLRSVFGYILTSPGSDPNVGRQYADYTPEQVFMEFQELVVSDDINKAKSLTVAPFMKYWEEENQHIRRAPFDLAVVDVDRLDNTANLRVEGNMYRVKYPSENGRTMSISVDRHIETGNNVDDPRRRPGAVVSEYKARGNVKLYKEEDGWKILAIRWNTWGAPADQISIEKPVLVPTLE